MTNYEWLKTLSAPEVASLMNRVEGIYTGWVGDPFEVILLWLKSERVDCLIKDNCLRKDSNDCLTCWSKADRSKINLYK